MNAENTETRAGHDSLETGHKFNSMSPYFMAREYNAYTLCQDIYISVSCLSQVHKSILRICIRGMHGNAKFDRQVDWVYGWHEIEYPEHIEGLQSFKVRLTLFS